MNFRILLLFVPLLIFGIVGWTLIRMGIFKSIELREETIGPLILIGREHIGPYHEINEAIQEVEKWAKARSIDCQKSFGLFLDDPEVVEHSRLRSLGGCLTHQIPDALPSDFKSETRVQQKYLVAYFDGSPALGPWKVYSAAYDEIRKRNRPRPDKVTEIYSFNNKGELQTQYLFPISD